MPQRDLFVIENYFKEFKVLHKECDSEIDSIISLIEIVNKKCISLNTSITLPRQNIIDCTICNKRVVSDG